MTTLTKHPPIRSVKLITWAQGNPAGCQIRLPGCQWGPTVGAHVPHGVRHGKGAAHKPHDVCLALACDSCHCLVDGRIKTNIDHEFILLSWHNGMLATLVLAIRDGLIKVEP